MAENSLVGNSRAHLDLLSRLQRVASTDAEILITGPTGVGKELYARFAHENSPRASQPFVPVNCGAIPFDLFENELFGHVGGAFTGARPQRVGIVTAAEGGTLLLDEVDSLSAICQVKMLRFLQEKEYRKLGETRIRRANVRVIAATNENLVAAVQEGRFREDLFFRLRVIPIEVPPLAKRKEDVPILVAEFIKRYSHAYKVPTLVLSAGAMERLEAYDWPGNIRELENCIRYLTCLQFTREVQAADLPLLEFDAETETSVSEIALDGQPFHDAKRAVVDEFERTYLQTALHRSRGNIARAARASGKPRRVFFELMRKHGLARTDFQS